MSYDTIEFLGLLENGQGDLSPFELDPLIQKPVSALTFLSNQAKLDSFNCPAVVDYLKNVYYITSPISFSIQRHVDGKFTITNTANGQDLRAFLQIGLPERALLFGRPMFTILLQYVFINKDNDVTMEVIDPPLFHNGLTNITGEYNISKWIRPTNFCCFMDPNIEQLNIERGDPLYAVRFRSKTNNFKLVEVTDDKRKEQILAEQRKALAVKKYLPGIKLQQMYDLFKKRMDSLWR
jgi:hypothetical protein